jgi:ATP-binding cassette subfamily B protein
VSQFAKIGHLLHEAIRVYLRPYWKLHILLAFAVAVAVLFEVCVPLTIKFLVDAALIPHDAGKLAMALVVLVALFALSALARHVVAVIKAHLNGELYRDLYSLLIRLLQRLPMSYFDQAQPGHFAPLFDTELLTLSRTLRDLFTSGFHAILQFTVVATTLFILSWQLAVAVALMLPLVVLRPQRRLRPTVEAIDQIRKVAERHNSVVMDHVSSQALVRAFGRGESSTRRIIENAGRKDGRAALGRWSDVKRVVASPHFQMLTFKLSMDNQEAILTLLVIGAGAILSFSGMLTLGTFSAFILLLPGLLRAVGSLSDQVQELGRATLSLDRFEQVEHVALPEAGVAALTSLPAPTRSLQFEGVDFGYVSGVPCLREVNLTLPIGQSMAFVGRSGSGKTTLFKLLLGLYDPTAGRVLIDGRDLRQVNPASFGAHVGTVLQQSVLLNTTIRNNICFAKPEATDEEIANAARLAEVHDFIVTLPDGYDSDVGEGGKRLSEGQKQRIALARAILPDPAILLLDEVTASLDPESEAAINATIQRLARQRTVVLVTHRLASVSFVDQLAVIDQGQVREQGRHEELLARQGLYHRLWQMQSGFVVSGDGHHAEVRGERLQAIPLFRGVAVETLNRLAERFVSKSFLPEQSIYEEGQPGDKFFIVVRGMVSVSTRDAAGKSIRLADLEDGDYFGEGEMLSRGRRTTTVTTRTPTLVLALRAEHFDAMMDEHSSLNRIVTQMALGRSLSTICSVGRRRRSHPIWQELSQRSWS